MGLRDLRQDAALTQLELAQRAGLSKTTIVNIEAGRIAPHPPTVRKLAAALAQRQSDIFSKFEEE